MHNLFAPPGRGNRRLAAAPKPELAFLLEPARRAPDAKANEAEAPQGPPLKGATAPGPAA